MKTITNQTFTYYYDPTGRRFNIMNSGKPVAGFRGSGAEAQFHQHLDKGYHINIIDMSEQEKKNLIRRFHAALAKLNIIDHKPAIIAEYGAESTTELSINQLEELVDRFTDQVKKEAPAHTRRLRSDVLTQLTSLGITGWDRVNAYLMLPRISGKMLYQMSDEELRNLRRKLHSILDKKAVMDAEVDRVKMMN